MITSETYSRANAWVGRTLIGSGFAAMLVGTVGEMGPQNSRWGTAAAVAAGGFVVAMAGFTHAEEAFETHQSLIEREEGQQHLAEFSQRYPQAYAIMTASRKSSET